MDLSQLGERKIIKIFEREFSKSRCKNAVVGIGDDACVVKFGSKYLAISTDALYQKTHIPREMTPRQIGKFAVNANLSDIAAMGAAPIGLVFSFGLPKNLNENFVEELSKGISEACRAHKTCVLGGDTKEHSEIVIAGTAFGSIENKILTRDAAKAGDLICITGSMGSAAAGFYCLINGIENKKLIKVALEPSARTREGVLLGRYANACIDISDGLAFSLHEIARASRTGFLIYEEKIPVSSSVKKAAELSGVPLREIVFHKGGDYELLFTIPPKKFEGMKKEMKKIGTRISIIGEMTKKGAKIVNENGKAEELEPRGFESFVTKF